MASVETEAVLPQPRLARGLAQRPFGQRQDQPRFLGQRNEVAGRHQLVAALPAHQRLGADHARRAHVDHRLVVQHQLVALDGLVQRAFQLELLAPAAGQLRAVDGRGVLALRLDREHGHVGIAHQVGHRAAVAREDGDAHAGGDEAFLPAHQHRVAHHFQDAVGHALRVALVADLGQQRDELVAAQAAHRLERAVRARAHRLERALHHLLAVAHAGTQALRHFHQQLVAGGMAERVVDDLEAVQVDQQERAGVAQPPRMLDRALHAPHQLAPVGQPGQRIEVGQVADAVFGDAAVGHVLHDAGVADAVAVLVELGLGLDVDDALAAVGQRHRHVGGQHRAVLRHALQQAQHRAALGALHQAQHAAQADAGRPGHGPSTRRPCADSISEPPLPAGPARRQSKLPMRARSCARASLAWLRSSSMRVREARSRYCSRPASRLHWLALTKKSVAPAW